MILGGLVLTRSLVVRRKANKLKQSLKQFPNRLLAIPSIFHLETVCYTSDR